MTDEGSRPAEPLSIPGFARFWGADAITTFGTFTTTVAVDVLVVQLLEASEAQVGMLRAVQFLPYLLVGLLAGALIDRWRRRPALIATNLGVGISLLAIPALWLLGGLSLPAVAAVLFVVGTFAVFQAAAEQSYVPDLVPRESLVAANARIGQAATVSETSGPAIGGALTALITAPFTLAVTAVANLAAAWTVSTITTPEPVPDPPERRALLRDIGDGLRFICRHRVLAPLALSTLIWFLANSAAMTVFAVFALRTLGLSPFVYGLMLACVGIGGLAGAFCAPAVTRRIGEGGAITIDRALIPLAWLGIALVPDAGPLGVGCLVAALLALGFGLGLSNPAEMGYRQAVTPRSMLGRVNASMRSANRTMAVVGALVGGALAGALDHRVTLVLTVAVFAVALAISALSPVRTARTT